MLRIAIYTAAVLVALAMFLVLASHLRRPRIRSATETPTIGAKLIEYSRQRSDYTFFIGVPVDRPARWEKVLDIGPDGMLVDSGELIRANDIQAGLVAYPNGQVVWTNRSRLPLPAGISVLEPATQSFDEMLQLSELEFGSALVQVTHGRSIDGTPGTYSTTLTNNTPSRIRVNRFAGYVETSNGWRIHTVTGDYYSSEEFNAWYGADEGWIMPGQSVCDHNNYGGPQMLWAYSCESEFGETFIAGAITD